MQMLSERKKRRHFCLKLQYSTVQQSVHNAMHIISDPYRLGQRNTQYLCRDVSEGRTALFCI